jgi:hypothetical protein
MLRSRYACAVEHGVMTRVRYKRQDKSSLVIVPEVESVE